MHHGCSGSVGREIGDDGLDEGLHGGKCDGSRWLVGGSGCCFRQFVSGLVAWYALVAWNPDEGGGAFSVV